MRVEARPGVSTSTLPSISVLVRPREDRDSHTAHSRLGAQPVQQTETRLLTNYPAEYQLLRSLAVWLVRDVTEQNSLIFIRRSIIYLSSLVTALTTGGMFFICKDRCMCTSSTGQPESSFNNPTVLYCFGEVSHYIIIKLDTLSTSHSFLLLCNVPSCEKKPKLKL